MAYRRYEPQVQTAVGDTTGTDVALDEKVAYLVTHLGRRGSTTGVTNDVMIGVNAAYGSTDFAVGTRKGVLMYQETMPIGPGVSLINIRTEGDDVDVMIVPTQPRPVG